jgi:hypothetical protein
MLGSHELSIGSIAVSMAREEWRRAVAVATAYLLVLQAVLTGLVLGAHADPAHRGALAAIICSAAGADSNHSGPPLDNPDRITCCVLGCGMSGPGLTPPPAGAVIAPLPPAEAVAVSWTPRTPVDRGAERTPRNTRAPPA